MTRQIYDEFTKEYIEELFSALGQIEKSKKVKSERREIDIFFKRKPETNYLTNLGLLGIIAQNSCLIEPFRNPCTEIEIM